MLKKRADINEQISLHKYAGDWNIRVEKLVIAPDPYCEDPDCEYDELIFYVPSDWLLEWLKKNCYPVTNLTDMTRLLKEEYTSEDSENVWDDAVSDCMIVHYEII